jgi:hypothetical protein
MRWIDGEEKRMALAMGMQLIVKSMGNTFMDDSSNAV